MKYRIFPPIGLARVGDSKEFFVGPEWPGGLGIEIAADGSESEVVNFKDSGFFVKRQAARFRVFEFADDSAPGRPIQLSPGARIKWIVHLVNKKAAIQRPLNPPDPGGIMFPIATPLPGKVLDGGIREIVGARAGPIEFTPAPGAAEPQPTYLGELQTDGEQRLMVLGGRGESVGDESKLHHFYRNETWYDDISDGPVNAEIVFADGTTSRDVEPAWVMVAPPDFAPTVPGIVTLYDLLYQVGYEHFGFSLPASPSFTEHIYPLVRRAIDWQWVHAGDSWSEFSTDFPALSAASCAVSAPPLRAETINRLRDIHIAVDRLFLLDFQNDLLDLWEQGRVACDWQGVPAVDRSITPEGLTRAALEAGVGARLHPGIEAGAIMTRKEIYSSPFAFRLSHAVLDAGDLTALMAVPWQADFWECSGHWWPSQRPDIVRASRIPNDIKAWTDGVSGHLAMVRNSTKLAVLRPKTDSNGETVGMREEGRHPSLPPRT